MGRLLVIGVVLGAVWLALPEGARREAGELVRDFSDRLTMLALRLTSGFAADVPDELQQQDRARRLRWR